MQHRQLLYVMPFLYCVCKLTVATEHAQTCFAVVAAANAAVCVCLDWTEALTAVSCACLYLASSCFWDAMTCTVHTTKAVGMVNSQAMVA
jgi:hypothetical protein